MPGFRLCIAVVLLVLLGGCSGRADDEARSSASSGPSGTATTAIPERTSMPTKLPWDERSLEGDLRDVRPSDCTSDGCPLGIATLADAAVVADGGVTSSRPEVQIAITEDTRLLTCGPTDGFVSIPIEAFTEQLTQVVGEQPTAVWTAAGADLDMPEPVTATQITSGSCG